MSNKNKNNQPYSFEQAATHAGLTLMAMASLIVATEFTERESHRMIVQPQAAYAFVNINGGEHGAQDMRRGSVREEIRHASASYGATMRSHPTAGSV